MRAMVVTAYDQPLEPADLAEPDVPQGYALLEVLTCGVCFSDVKTSRGHMPYSSALALPHVPGHEICGRVLETNPAGLVGDGTLAVVYHYWPCGRCRSCRRGDETLCSALTAWTGFTHDGGFRERIAVPVDRLIEVPPGVDPVHAAPTTCAVGTAYRSVVTRGGVRAGTTVAVLGLGGVGIHAAQIARSSGATLVGFDVHDATIEVARGLGIDARRAEDPESLGAVLDVTGGEGVDVVVDTVGHDETLAMAAAMVRAGGRIVGVGYAPRSELRLATPRLVLDEIEIVGSRYAHRNEVGSAAAMVAAGLVEVVVGMVRPLEAVNEVFEALGTGDLIGRAVLDIAGVTDA